MSVPWTTRKASYSCLKGKQAGGCTEFALHGRGFTEFACNAAGGGGRYWICIATQGFTEFTLQGSRGVGRVTGSALQRRDSLSSHCKAAGGGRGVTGSALQRRDSLSSHCKAAGGGGRYWICIATQGFTEFTLQGSRGGGGVTGSALQRRDSLSSHCKAAGGGGRYWICIATQGFTEFTLQGRGSLRPCCKAGLH